MNKILILLTIILSLTSYADSSNSLISVKFEEKVMKQTYEEISKFKTLKEVLNLIKTNNRQDHHYIQDLISQYGDNPMPRLSLDGNALTFHMKKDIAVIESVSSLERIYKINEMPFQYNPKLSVIDTLGMIQRIYQSRKIREVPVVEFILKSLLGSEAFCNEVTLVNDVMGDSAMLWGAISLGVENGVIKNKAKQVLAEERPQVSDFEKSLEAQYGEKARIDVSCQSKGVSVAGTDKGDFNEGLLKSCCQNKSNECDLVINAMNDTVHGFRNTVRTKEWLKSELERRTTERSITETTYYNKMMDGAK